MKNNCTTTCSRHASDKAYSYQHESDQNLPDKQRIVFISPYDLGRQPFALAEPSAIFVRAGYDAKCLDLSQQKLTDDLLAPASVVFIYLSMLTATRIAVEAMPRILKMAPFISLCSSSCDFLSSASLVMERNFQIRKVRPLSPILS